MICRAHSTQRTSFIAVLTAALLTASATTPVAAQEALFDRTRPPATAETPPLTVPTVLASRLSNGLALRVVEQRDLPLVQVTLSIAGGGRLDRDTPGLATFAANLMDEGAGARDANALQSALAFLGASLSTGANWDATTISLKVARRNLEAALDLMADVVLRPTFSASEVRRQRDLRLAALLQQKDQPGVLASLSFAQALFPIGHPYRHALGGDSTSTARFDSTLVREFHRGGLRPERATFYIVGDLSAADAQRVIGARFRSWVATGAERQPAPVLVTPAAPQGRQVILVDKPGAAQSVIIIGTTGLERTNADYAAVEVMNTILGGSFSSRLMTNLRETKGYTYGASSGFTYRPLPGPFSVSSSVRTDVSDSALIEIFKELRALRETPVSAEELARAKAYLTLAVPGDLESTSQIASEMADLANWNLPLAWLREYVTRVGAVAAADVQRVAKQLLPSENAYVVVVGDLARIQSGIEALALGPVSVRAVSTITHE